MSLPIQKNVPLQTLNTFGLPSSARYFASITSDEDLRAGLQFAAERNLDTLILGGGSNLLLTRDVDALVLHMVGRGVRVVSDDGEQVVIEAEAGEPWHPFVLDTLARGLVGLENLSLIPGTVGASPIQNIGAYGVELKDVFEGLDAWDRHEGRIRSLDAGDCAFGYRDSRFKREPGRWIVLRVRFRLHRHAGLRLEYGAIRQWLKQDGIDSPTALDVSRAVCAIRREKLPDPAALGNAGSFFKNPVVDSAVAASLQAAHPGIVIYPQGDGSVKLAAGWLIEQAGWKGHREGDAGVHTLQALVLVNHGAAHGEDILLLARRIQASVAERFGVVLEIEPSVL